MSAAIKQPQTRFVSLRWRLMLPIFVIVLVVAMAGAYALGSSLTANMNGPQTNLLLQNSRAIAARATELYEQSRLEAQRIAFTSGVTDALRASAAERLHTLVEGSARLSNLDSVILTNPRGIEVVGLLRVERPEGVDYAVNTSTDWHNEPVIRAVVDESYVGATGLVRTPEGLMLYTAIPVNDLHGLSGIVAVGRSMDTVLETLKADGVTEIALYGQDNSLLQSTILPENGSAQTLAIEPEMFQQALSGSGQQVTVQNVRLGSGSYWAAYFPLQFGPQTLGVVGAFAPDSMLAVAGVGRQLTALTLASIAAAVVIGVFFALNRSVIQPTTRIRKVATALASGQATVRTGMKATDEIGAMGQALDQYANYVQDRQDALRTTLRRQRRESEYLLAVLESIPDGIVVQDIDGRVIVMNERARDLLGSQKAFRDSKLHTLTAVVTDVLGAALAPGMYALGDPQRVELEGSMLSAQAAAILNMAHQRVGTVVVLRDITREVRRERAQEIILSEIEQAVQKPLLEASREPVSSSARELGRHAAALQKLIVEMREITMPQAPGIREGQRPLHLETLIWTIANEWRQVSSAANLTLDVIIERKKLHILGDERRLRWAIGNLVDNAIKYTPPGGKLTLEIRDDSNGQAHLRIRDNGVGITPEEMPLIFTRFFRGTPTTKDGRVIRVPGTGQGLNVAKQIIESHGGLLQIKSKPGVGTAVYFTLPLTAAISYELPQLALDVDLDGETIRLEKDDL